MSELEPTYGKRHPATTWLLILQALKASWPMKILLKRLLRVYGYKHHHLFAQTPHIKIKIGETLCKI
jgi:hypothetical protein